MMVKVSKKGQKRVKYFPEVTPGHSPRFIVSKGCSKALEFAITGDFHRVKPEQVQ